MRLLRKGHPVQTECTSPSHRHAALRFSPPGCHGTARDAPQLTRTRMRDGAAAHPETQTPTPETLTRGRRERGRGREPHTPRHETRHPNHETRNPKPDARRPTPETLKQGRRIPAGGRGRASITRTYPRCWRTTRTASSSSRFLPAGSMGSKNVSGVWGGGGFDGGASRGAGLGQRTPSCLPSRSLAVSTCVHAATGSLHLHPTTSPLHSVEFEVFIKSQLASLNQQESLMWCKFDHTTPRKTGLTETLVFHREGTPVELPGTHPALQGYLAHEENAHPPRTPLGP